MNYNHEDAVTIRTNGRKNDASALCALRDVLEGKALIYDACTETSHHSLNPCEGITLKLADEPDMDMIEVAIRAVEEVFDWRQFIAEYYSEADNPVEALVASEAELAISGSLIHGNEETRTIDIEEQKSEDNQETELTPEQKYLQMGREMEFGMDDTDRESFAFVYEASDESESTVYDNSIDYNADDKAEELTEEEVVAGFEFETGKEPEEEQYPEDVPMFKQKRLEDR